MVKKATHDLTTGTSACITLEPPPYYPQDSQLLIEASLAARLEVAHDDPQLSYVLHELLQVLLQVIKLLRHVSCAGSVFYVSSPLAARHAPVTLRTVPVQHRA